MLNQIHFSISIIVIFLSTFIIGNIAYFLKERKNWKSSSSRKFNHFGISLVSIIFFSFIPIADTIVTAIFTSLSILIIYIISANSNRPLVQSIIQSNIRTRDEPHGTFFVFLPLITGQIALYISLIFINPVFAKIAFCSMGFGDGLAEPIGTKFGKHKYKVKDILWKTENTKSLQGSAAVLIVSFLASIIILYVYQSFSYIQIIYLSILYSIFISFIEGISPRGLDNFLIIILGTLFLNTVTKYTF